MSRLFNQPVAESTGHAAQLYTAIKAAVGIVPNAYVNIGSNSPIALATLLNIDGALKKGTLGAKEGEVVKLVVSQAAECDYCLAAHTLIGKKNGTEQGRLIPRRLFTIRDFSPVVICVSVKPMALIFSMAEADMVPLVEIDHWVPSNYVRC